MQKDNLKIKVRVQDSEEFEKVIKAFFSEKKIIANKSKRFAKYDFLEMTLEEAFKAGQAFMENKVRRNLRDGVSPLFNKR
jgi:hypothetical protein